MIYKHQLLFILILLFFPAFLESKPCAVPRIFGSWNGSREVTIPNIVENGLAKFRISFGADGNILVVPTSDYALIYLRSYRSQYPHAKLRYVCIAQISPNSYRMLAQAQSDDRIWEKEFTATFIGEDSLELSIFDEKEGNQSMSLARQRGKGSQS